MFCLVYRREDKKEIDRVLSYVKRPAITLKRLFCLLEVGQGAMEGGD